MHPVQKHLIETNFRDLAGSRLEGTLALSDEVINLGLGELIAQLRAATPAPAPEAEAVATDGEDLIVLDPKALLALLDVDKLHYRTERGRTLLDVAVGLREAP